MGNTEKMLSFEEIVKQNERRVHYYIHRLHVRDTDQEFYQEGLVAMWRAYEKHEPDKGPLTTYFNFTIKHRLIDLIRKKAKQEARDLLLIEQEKISRRSGNRIGRTNMPMPDKTEMLAASLEDWQSIKSLLTEKQWKWVYGYIISDMPVKEIAVQEGVSADAVKSWGRQARKKLRDEAGSMPLATILEG